MTSELIRKLADKALDEIVPYTWTTLDYEEVQKLQNRLAELIVRECIDQARSEEDRFYGIDADDLALTMEHFQEVLKHHFGVE